MEHRDMVASVESMDFSDALDGLKNGFWATRAGWNGLGQWIVLQRPDEHSLMDLPYLYIVTVGGKRVPWIASQTDLLAEDWHVSERAA